MINRDELRAAIAAILEELTPARTSRLYNVTAVADGFRTVYEWKRVAFPPDVAGYVLLNLPSKCFLEHPNGTPIDRIELRVELAVDPVRR